jgi:hypothetical protein
MAARMTARRNSGEGVQVIAVVHNATDGIMGGIKIDLEQ